MNPLPCMCTAVVLLLGSFPSTAAAQLEPKIEAGRHFDRGLSLAKQKSYREAIDEFNRAYELSPHYSVMYNLGQAYLAIAQPVFAVEALRRYLSEGDKAVPAARRRQVEATIAAQERQIGSVTASSEPAGAAIRVDGIEVGRTPLAVPIRLRAGQHAFVALLDGYLPWEQKLEVAGREHKSLEIRLEPIPTAMPIAGAGPAVPMLAPPPTVVPFPATAVAPMGQAVSPSAQAAAAQPPASFPLAPVPPGGSVAPASTPLAGSMATSPREPRRTRKIVGYVLGSVGVGSLVVGSVFGLRAFSKRADSDKRCPNEVCTREGVQLNDQAKTAATVSTATFAVGLTGVAVATYLLLTSGPASPGPAPTLAGRLRIAPEVGRGQAGVAVGGAW
jgi:hypothetical protein